MRGTIILLLILGISLYFVHGWETPSYAPETSHMHTFVVGSDGESYNNGISYEITPDSNSHDITTGESDIAWLYQQSERRQSLTQFRVENFYKDEEAERLDRVKSKNWRTVIDGEERRGYEVIEDINGEFEDFPDEPRSEKVLNAVFHYRYS